jgi:class 3 adenylate cyclase
LLERGRALFLGGAVDEAAGSLRKALRLWRGPPLADFSYEPFARNEIARLTDLRLVALEQRLEADLALGRHAAAVPELEALVGEHPLRESLRALLMVSLYRAGRQADALAVYQDARTVLDEEVGLVSGQPLQRLERAILVQDPSLDLPEVAPETAATDAPEASVAVLEDPKGPPARERSLGRKTVTVLACDVVAPALLGQEADPEVPRELLERYATNSRATIEFHGGTVDTLVGHAVTAVFGVPVLHEDDALRAVRAAIEMRDALPAIDLQVRIGISTGEVVTGGEERLVTGEAVNVAVAIAQAAAAKEVLIDNGSLALVRNCVEVEPIEPLEFEERAKRVGA